MVPQQFPSHSPDDFDSALSLFMESLPGLHTLEADVLKRNFQKLSEVEGVVVEFNPFKDSESGALQELVRGDFDWAARSDERYEENSISAIMFTAGCHITGQAGEQTALFVEARDKDGNSAFQHAGYLEIFKKGSVATVVFQKNGTETIDGLEVLFSRAALEEGLANLLNVDLSDYADPEDYPYLLWLGIEELKDAMREPNLSVSDLRGISGFDLENSTFILDTVFGSFLISYDLHPEHSTVTADCKELEDEIRA